LILNFDAKSIPAFSRKYGTSCITCHSSYPKLNSFGEVFRMNGYRFPDNDKDQIKEEQLALGSPAYKRVFPKAVYPNSIPPTAPLSIRGRGAFEVVTLQNATTGEFNRPALQLYAAGVVGDRTSIFVGAHLFENGEAGSIDNFALKINDLFSKFLPEKLIAVKVGQFIPEIVPFASNHRSITQSAYAFNTYDPSLGSAFVAGHTHGGEVFGIENFQLGVEFSGIIKNRTRYVLGIVNGSGTSVDINSDKDFYGRLAYKIGGMAFYGSLKDSTSNASETSLTIGTFGYKGIGTSTVTGMNYNFYRAGCDVNFNFSKLNFVGGYIYGSNGINDSQKYDLYFGEINYSVYPWLIALLRYEQANPRTKKSVIQIVPHISALLVENVRVKVETRLNPNDLKFSNFYLGFDFAL